MSFSNNSSLFEIFQKSCEIFPEKQALVVNGSGYTYSEIGKLASQVHNLLMKGNIKGKASRVGIFLNKGIDAYVAILGTLSYDCAYVPLNPEFSITRLNQIVNLADLGCVIYNSASEGRLKQLLANIKQEITLINVDSNLFLNEGNFFSNSIREENYVNSEAYVLFTSGTTGVPKGISISQINVLSYINNIINVYDFNSSDRFSQFFDFSFDLSVHDMFICWAVGACLCVPDKSDMLIPNSFINKNQISVWFSVPSLAVSMQRGRMLKAHSLPSLRYSLFCGEALPVSIIKSWREAAPNSIIDNLYGPTEATIAFTHFRVNDAHSNELDSLSVVPIGQPLGDLECVIVDEDDNVIDNEQTGELYLAGNQLSVGYIKDPNRSKSVFKEISFAGKKGRRWYQTGDLVSWSKFGLNYHGRIDSQLKIQGYRIETHDVEEMLRRTLDIAEVAVIGSKLSAHDDVLHLIAFVTQNLDISSALDLIKLSCTPYMQPKNIVIVDSFPLNSNGKVDYKILKNNYESKLAGIPA